MHESGDRTRSTFGFLTGSGLGLVVSAMFSVNVGMGIAIGAALGLVLASAFSQRFRHRDG